MPGLECAVFGGAVPGEPMSRHTTARIGGPADWFIEATSADDLRDLVLTARREQMPCFVLGGGSNILVSDQGIRGLVILNKARQIKFQVSNSKSQTVRVESGVILPTLARECIERGLAGLEWAIGVPGTVGGAVVGNAGAHGSDMARNLVSATILDADDHVREWSKQELQFGYRSSNLKSQISNIKHLHCAESKAPCGQAQVYQGPVVLATTLELTSSTREELESRAAEFTEKRKRTQPPGASMGSMFKNPPGDYAGRLIEAAGLKGARMGSAAISQVHANFFVNAGGARAQDVYALICMAKDRVKTEFGIELELEIELVGEW